MKPENFIKFVAELYKKKRSDVLNDTLKQLENIKDTAYYKEVGKEFPEDDFSQKELYQKAIEKINNIRTDDDLRERLTTKDEFKMFKFAVEVMPDEIVGHTTSELQKQQSEKDLIEFIQFVSINRISGWLPDKFKELEEQAKQRLEILKLSREYIKNDNTVTQNVSDGEQKDGISEVAILKLKKYFNSQFKGMGNGNINYFDDYLIPDLKKCRTGKDYATIAKLMQDSRYFIRNLTTRQWVKWYEIFCDSLQIKQMSYRKTQLDTSEMSNEFYYL